jgi:hypothetical protein
MISLLSKKLLTLNLLLIPISSACSQGKTNPELKKPTDSSADSSPQNGGENSLAAGDSSSAQPGETADVPKVVTGAYLFCQANDKLIDEKYLVKCSIKDEWNQRIEILSSGLSVQFAYEVKEEDGIFVDLTTDIDDKSFDVVYLISGRDYESLDLFSKSMTFKAEISEIQSGDSRTITLSGDRVTTTILKTTILPVLSK